jgi:NADPH:quinone reductase
VPRALLGAVFTRSGQLPSVSDMRSVIVRRFGGPEVLEVSDVPVPEPGPDQVRVRVDASAVNPIDLSTRAGRLVDAGLMVPGQRIGMGWDLAGTVTSTGEGVASFAPGDRVIGLRDLLFAPGAHAEEVVLHEGALAPAPASVSPVAAATLPLNALTADRALALADLRAGDTLVVTGAAGAVGGFVLELAALRGLRTIAVAGADDEALVRELGATDFIARTDGSLGPAVRRIVPRGADVVIDAAVAGIAAHDALRAGGTFIGLVAPFAPPPIRGTHVHVQEVWADGGRLAELSALADAGRLSLRVAESYPLEAAAEAHARVEAGGVRGRVLLTP